MFIQRHLLTLILPLTRTLAYFHLHRRLPVLQKKKTRKSAATPSTTIQRRSLQKFSGSGA
jgi:hypothetical protein